MTAFRSPFQFVRGVMFASTKSVTKSSAAVSSPDSASAAKRAEHVGVVVGP